MIPGLMQPTPLLISSIIDYAAAAHPAREIVSRLIDEPNHRYNYAAAAHRSSAVASMLTQLGVQSGDRVSSLAWNTHRHFELFFGVTGIGAVLHTANPRLHEDQLVYTFNHAGSRILFYDANFTDMIARIRPRLTQIEHFISLGAAIDAGGPVERYEALLADARPIDRWPVLDENAGAFLCYTSGTTGVPKGVLYSHRAVVLHAMGAGLPGALGLTAFDVVMPCSSMYHATAWGLPFVAPIAGAKLVLPADNMGAAALHALIDGEGVTFTGGVPTIWTAYLQWLQQEDVPLNHLKRVVIAGSAVPRSMAEAFGQRHGVEVLQLWGMTETCPLGVVATPTPALADKGEAYLRDVIWTRQGRLQYGIELRIVDEDSGVPIPHDGQRSGALQVRGPWVVRRYFGADVDVVDQDGWFDTGDVATLDEDGFMRITDRAKDVIKSGGEWISSIDLENLAAGAPGVKIAAVIGLPHPRWDERPILIVEPHDDVVLNPEMVADFIRPQIAKWWMPDKILLGQVPLTATGKIDKKALRNRYTGFFDNIDVENAR